MNIIRKLRNAPGRIRSWAKELAYVFAGIREAMRDARLIRKRLQSTSQNLPPAGGVVVINSARSWAISDIEVYLGYLLAKAGAEVHVLFDDGVLEHWDGAQSNHINYYSPPRARWCVRWRHELRRRLVCRAYRHPNLSIKLYSQIIGSGDLKATPAGWMTGYALSSTKRHFQEGGVDLVGRHLDYYEKSLRNCTISAAIGRYTVNRLKADRFITSHGIYSVWGPAYKVVAEAAIPIVVWQVAGTHRGKIRLVDRHDGVLAQTALWRAFEAATPDTDPLVKVGEEHLRIRTRHESQDTGEYFGTGQPEERLPGLDAIPEGATTFGIFPNVVWDGDIPERNIMFDNVVEWCEFTLRKLAVSEHHVVVRFHPAEATRLKGSVLMEDILRERIPDAFDCENVHVIHSSNPLNTYELVEDHIDVGLIYDGHLCLEMTYLDTPVIACTNGNFTEDRVVFKPESRDQYAKWLNDPKLILNRFAQDKGERKIVAAKFAVWEFEASLLDFSALVKPFPSKIDYSVGYPVSALSIDEKRIVSYITSQSKGGTENTTKLAMIANQTLFFQ